MTDPVKEQLSACLDGELPKGELDLLLRQFQRDPQLRQSIGRYALLGEALRGQRLVRASEGFADRVAAAVAAEATVKTTPGASQVTILKWLRPAAGMAIAAGVATIALVSLRPTTTETQQIAANAPTATVEPTEPAPSYTVPTNVDTQGSAFIPAARLTNYVVAHSEFSSPLGRRTVLSGMLSDDDDSQGDADTAEVKVTGVPQVSRSGSEQQQAQH
jgi:sigma-E factor negative regulatory protein RseA